MPKWEYQCRYYSESIEWAKMTESLDPSGFVFIQYIGMTTRIGIERCIEEKYRTFGLLRAFLRSLYDLFESLEELCMCYEFVDGSLEDLVSAPSGDLKEKSLTALFGHLSLLNKQHGGFLNDYVPSSRKKSLFLSLRTNAFELLNKCDERAQQRRALQHWTERMQVYANENADLTGTNRIPFSDAYRNRVLS